MLNIQTMPILNRVVVLENVSKKLVGWYLLNFETCGRWDPGIESSVRINGPLPADKVLPNQGDKYRVTLKDGNIMTYTALEVSPESADVWRIVLESTDGSLVYSKDTISVRQVGNNAEVTYNADLRLKGILSLIECCLHGKFNQVADDAMNGLRKAIQTDSMILNPPALVKE